MVTIVVLAVALPGCDNKAGRASAGDRPRQDYARWKTGRVRNGRLRADRAPPPDPRGPSRCKDGQYASGAKGPVVGKNRVEIRAPRNAGAESPNAGGDWKSDYVESVPARYNTQSTLEVEVRPGDNTFDFELKSQ